MEEMNIDGGVDMHGQTRLLSSIDGITPDKETLAKMAVKKWPGKVTVSFKTGQTGMLDMKNPRAVHWANIIDRLKRENAPVYVEIDEETGIITNLLIPMVDKVEALATDERGDVEVRLVHSPAIRILLKSDPHFEAIYQSLQSALADGAELLITETRDEHEIIDARPPMEPPEDPPEPVPDPPPDDPVSAERAQELFQDMNSESCNPCNPPAGCIPFKYPDNGCQHRAHKMSKMMVDDGEEPEKVWLSGILTVPTPNHPDCRVVWGWHVAPTLNVVGEAEKWVVDPSLGTSSESFTDWKNRQGDPGATERYSDWTEWDVDGRPDPDLTSTNHYLGVYAELLQDRCLQLGPPPYACTRNCFFIIDRNTFSDDEVEAMLHAPGPARIEAAFYIVADGFSPYELGFTSATMEMTPDLAVSPALSGITITPDRMEFEYPTHLNRRQRLTWVYSISFSDTSDFTGERVMITLDAAVSSQSGIGRLYLLRQPNPYEIDGETSWLSTDLRVFQIRTGQSWFGVTMGADPSAFITGVIDNLNTGDTGGQTFENDISVDQETSRLELSQRVDGAPVYNFAVAKVRYRALSLSATDVRVFFRLFPVATTSLEYDQATTYRRHESGGTVVPLLGLKNNETAAIPCFASPRIDSAHASMTSQTDTPNVQTIPPNPGGAEVARYFGCWLDINQPQVQFPIQPTPVDGPYASGRRSIQELIRNEHQCLVSEIAFTPAPAQNGSTPSLSDKLAQRNLAIVESANPGLVHSRRVPQTFEIRPSTSRLEQDELMIDWGNVPAGSIATLYLPGIDADDILLLAARKYRSHRLVRIDGHTLKFETGGITYLPIPFTDGNFPGLLTVDLPEGIVSGQVFTIVVRQVTGERQTMAMTHRMEASRPGWRHIVGSFQLTIPVREKGDILPGQERLLSNLRWIERAIPAGNRWSSVFSRYVAQIADRVDALGGDSSKVAPSASGEWREAHRLCRLLTLTAGMLITIFLILAGTLAGGLRAIVDIPVLILLIAVVFFWIRNCRPAKCQLLRTLVSGAGIATVVLAVLATLKVAAPHLVNALVASYVITAAAAAVGWVKGCFK
jgi:hypothetical protein